MTAVANDDIEDDGDDAVAGGTIVVLVVSSIEVFLMGDDDGVGELDRRNFSSWLVVMVVTEESGELVFLFLL